MARHRNYSKRSRESRKAMTDGADDHPEYSDVKEVAEDWPTHGGEPDRPPQPVT